VCSGIYLLVAGNFYLTLHKQEPDSAQELAAREEDLLHGCQQVQRVIDYATANTNQFMSSVFGEKSLSEYKFIPCVISKKGIRVRNNPIPVISLSTFFT
jgi:hypothetical protein